MTLRILLFGHYRDAISLPGEGSMLTIQAPPGATPASVARLLGDKNPRLSDLLARTRVAVNAEFSDAETLLSDGDEVAFLPPMSGG